MQPVLLSCLCRHRQRLFFSNFPGNNWVASFMLHAFQGSTFLHLGIYDGLSKSAYLQLDFELMWRSRSRNHFSRDAFEVAVRAGFVASTEKIVEARETKEKRSGLTSSISRTDRESLGVNFHCNMRSGMSRQK